MIIGERWPKSGVEVVITVLEGDEDHSWGNEVAGEMKGSDAMGGWGMMNVLAGCITVASAAIADAGIDCVDLVSGGVAGIVEPSGKEKFIQQNNLTQDGVIVQDGAHVVLDPCPCEHQEFIAACVVGYLAGRDELTEIWLKGTLPSSSGSLIMASNPGSLVDRAVASASEARRVLDAAVKEAVEYKSQHSLAKSDSATSTSN